MNTHAKAPMQSEMRDTVPMICWMFQRRDDAVTCEVDFDPRRSRYDLYVTAPRGSSDDPFVERFDRASAALQRHAEIASMLRQAGWTVSGYSQSSV
jgi:hypothetical protein